MGARSAIKGSRGVRHPRLGAPVASPGTNLVDTCAFGHWSVGDTWHNSAGFNPRCLSAEFSLQTEETPLA